MEQPKEYYAFISYKREDEKWAKWLQDKLEHYRFPTNLNGRIDLPKHIRPTFRDVTDLKPGLLAEEIDNALRNSEWLIVVCSPRSAKSPWVCKEAQTFIDLGRADHIIPFVIEGNPFSIDTTTECYPEALLNLTGSKELLAANINEMGRDAAAIKVVARMFNLHFDVLWQRHEREQMRKKCAWIGGAIFLGLLGLCIGGYFVKQNRIIENQKFKLENAANRLREDSLTLANHVSRIQNDSLLMSIQKDSIQKTNMLLKATNKDLLQANNDLRQANLKIQQSNWNLKVSNAKIIAERAMELLENGESVEAINMISQICSDDDIYKFMYIPEIEQSIRTVHRSSSLDGIKGRLLFNGGLDDFIQFSRNGNTFYMKQNNSLVQYDLLTGESKGTVYTVPCKYNSNSEYYVFDDLTNTFIYSVEDTIFVKNVVNNTNILEPIILPEDYLCDVQVSPNMDYLIYELLWDESKWTMGNTEVEPNYCNEFHVVNLRRSPISDEVIPSWSNFYCFTPDGNGAFVKTEDGSFSWDFNKNETTGNGLNFEGRIHFAQISRNGNLFVASDSVIYVWKWPSFMTDENIDPIKLSSPIMRIQTNPDGNLLAAGLYDGSVCIWEFDPPFFHHGKLLQTLKGHNSYVSSILFSPNGKNMFTASSGAKRLWDIKHKGIIESFSTNYDFICPSGKTFLGRTSDNYRVLADVKTKTQIGEALFKLDSETIGWLFPYASRNSETIVYQTYDSLAYVLQPVSGGGFIIKLSSDYYSTMFSVDKEGRYLAIGERPNSLIIYDVKNQKPIFQTIHFSNESIPSIRAIAISPDASEIVVNVDNSLNLYSINTNGLDLRKVFFHGYNGQFKQIVYSPDGSLLATLNYDNTIQIWDPKSGKHITTFWVDGSCTKECTFSPDNKYFVASSTSDVNKVYIWNIQSGQVVESLSNIRDCRFCQDIPNKMYYYENGTYHFMDFLPLKTLVQSMAEVTRE